MPYAVCFDTMIEEMIARAMHSHPLFLVDNKAVYHLLEEATCNTAYAPSLATFAKKHDGRGASFAIMSQYAGEDKWLAKVKVQEKFMATEWKGQSNFLLEALITQHRNAFTSLQECAEHTSYQVLTEEGRAAFVSLLTALSRPMRTCVLPLPMSKHWLRSKLILRKLLPSCSLPTRSLQSAEKGVVQVPSGQP